MLGSVALRTLSISGPMVAGIAALLVLTDIPVALAVAVWIAPLVVLIPYAYPQGGRRAYGLWTVVTALVLPAISSIWVVSLVLTRGRIGHH